jgi:hypothetical protein
MRGDELSLRPALAASAPSPEHGIEEDLAQVGRRRRVTDRKGGRRNLSTASIQRPSVWLAY